ncbi:MAG: hypothetical protein IKW28_05375, partial [Lachnospiraceae bacterium]|nr:hypothetical protein [Lachnospiraceae bacterium]
MKKLKERLISAFLVFALAAEGITLPAYAMEMVEKQEITESIENYEAAETMESLELSEEEETEENEEPKNKEENSGNKQLIFVNDIVTIYYGEDGSNKERNLDNLFLPIIKDDKPGKEEAEVTYRFFREGSEVYCAAGDKDLIPEEQLLSMLEEAEGEALSEMEAGTKVVIAVSFFEAEDKNLLYLVQGEIAKRELTLVGKQDTLILEKDRMGELNTFCITPEMKEYGDFLLEAKGSGFVKAEELQNLSEVINGNITLKAEETIEGEVSVKAGLFATLSEAFEVNYYITGDSFANIMIAQEDEPVSEVDKEEIKEEEQPIKDVSGNTTESEVSFTLNPSAIMYGESDNNETGTLDILFQPTYVINKEEAMKAENTGAKEQEPEYDISYKFVTDKEKLDTLTVDNFEQLEGEQLSAIPAGTVVYVAAIASSQEQPDVIATDSFTVEKRKVLLHFEAPMEEAVNEKSNPDEDKLVF